NIPYPRRFPQLGWDQLTNRSTLRMGGLDLADLYPEPGQRRLKTHLAIEHNATLRRHFKDFWRARLGGTDPLHHLEIRLCEALWSARRRFYRNAPRRTARHCSQKTTKETDGIGASLLELPPHDPSRDELAIRSQHCENCLRR